MKRFILLIGFILVLQADDLGAEEEFYVPPKFTASQLFDEEIIGLKLHMPYEKAVAILETAGYGKKSNEHPDPKPKFNDPWTSLFLSPHFDTKRNERRRKPLLSKAFQHDAANLRFCRYKRDYTLKLNQLVIISIVSKKNWLELKKSIEDFSNNNPKIIKGRIHTDEQPHASRTIYSWSDFRKSFPGDQGQAIPTRRVTLIRSKANELYAEDDPRIDNLYSIIISDNESLKNCIGFK